MKEDMKFLVIYCIYFNRKGESKNKCTNKNIFPQTKTLLNETEDIKVGGPVSTTDIFSKEIREVFLLLDSCNKPVTECRIM